MNTTEWNVLRPNLEYTECGKIKPSTHMGQLNQIEKVLLELLQYYIINVVSFKEGEYTIGDHCLPLSSELSFWGEEGGFDDNIPLGNIYNNFYSVVQWFKCIHSFNECNDNIIDIDEMKRYLKGRSNDIRERNIILSRYTIIYELTETQMMLYIKNYYYMRFRGPLLDNLRAQEFSPK
jgi:hypothetical protein